MGRHHRSPLLITCSLGVARSASLVIAYVMRTLSLPLDEAYAFVRARAPGVMPDVGMMGRLVECEREWGCGRARITLSLSSGASGSSVKEDVTPKSGLTKAAGGFRLEKVVEEEGRECGCLVATCKCGESIEDREVRLEVAEPERRKERRARPRPSPNFTAFVGSGTCSDSERLSSPISPLTPVTAD